MSSTAFGAKLSASVPSSSAQVIHLAREAMKTALDDNESKAAEASGVSNELKPGVTIDLSRRNIEYLPDEVVDIIKNELERLVKASLPSFFGRIDMSMSAGLLTFLFIFSQIGAFT